MTKEFRYFSYLKLDFSVVTSCTKTDGKWKVAIFEADMARNYTLIHITAPAALMVRQQSSLIITPEWEYSS